MNIDSLILTLSLPLLLVLVLFLSVIDLLPSIFLS